MATTACLTSPAAGLNPLRLTVAYGLMIVAAFGIFWLIRDCGSTLEAPAGSSARAVAGPGSPGHILLHVLFALAAVIVVGRILGRLSAWIGQPPVIGEIMAGIVLGPSLMGQVAPAASAFLLPSEAAPFLGVIAQLGIILYMFLVGLELNTGLLRQRAHTTVAISHASIVVPFILGAALALYLYPRLSSSDVSFTSFALFLGVAMSITAFPVLARILTDLGLHRSKWGVVALTCAATDDVTAWCLLAFVVGVAQAQVGAALGVTLWAVAYIVFMALAVRPVAERIAARSTGTTLGNDAVALALVALLLSAIATEAIGVHAIFGAFLLGAVIPYDSALARTLTRKLESLVTILLLPAFFALTGMRTQIGLVAGWEQWLICGLIIVVATAGKFGGTLAAARLTGLGWRESAGLGVLMNTRGLMELIVLNIGLELGVISPTLFAMMVLMALATTALTTPLMRRLMPPARQPSFVTVEEEPRRTPIPALEPCRN